MLRHTGPGKIETRPVPPPAGDSALRASLFNYDIEGDSLKPEHEKWLLDNVVPLLPNPVVRVKLRGEASRSGSDSFNLALSNRRIDKVLKFLLGRGLAPGQFVRHGTGEDDARRAGEADGTEDEKFRAVIITIENILRRLLPVRFDRPFHLGINDGFDTTANPPWVMIPAEQPSRLMQVENAEGLSLVSNNTAVATPQPALFPLPGPVRINRGVQIFRIVGGVEGDAEIRAVDAQGRIHGRLQVSVLRQLTVKCAFHYVSNARYGTRTRRRGDEAEFLRILNEVWPDQANIRFEQVPGNSGAPPLVMKDNLGDEINLNGNRLSAEWFRVVNHRRTDAQFNVFFVREVETDAEGTLDVNGNLTDTADAVTEIGGNGDCIFEDAAGKDVGVTLAHEAGHCLTLDHESPIHSTQDMLMFPTTDQRGRFLPRAHVLPARRRVRRQP